MAEIPTTSTTLLRNIAHDSQHARWSEFVTRYRPMMEAFLRERFPTLEADDIIQDTLVAICAALPSYRYVPDEKGHFHNYLTGILKNKALRQLSKDHRQAELAEMVGLRVPRDRGRAGRASLPVPVLADLGLAKDITTSDIVNPSSDITLGGVGTPGYGAPEQMERGEASVASDIHALGVLADRCFDSKPPRTWRRIIERATSSIPERRYPSVTAFVRAIRRRNFLRMVGICASAAMLLAAIATCA